MHEDAREELNGGELGGEALPLHETLNHAHDAHLKVTNADRGQDFLDTLSCL